MCSSCEQKGGICGDVDREVAHPFWQTFAKIFRQTSACKKGSLNSPPEPLLLLLLLPLLLLPLLLLPLLLLLLLLLLLTAKVGVRPATFSWQRRDEWKMTSKDSFTEFATAARAMSLQNSRLVKRTIVRRLFYYFPHGRMWFPCVL